MELKHIKELEKATKKGRSELFRLGIGLLFIIAVMLYTIIDSGAGFSMFVVIAAMIGGYMAMNIGANDVANNVGPAVGSKALSLMWALVIASVFEAAGAILAGGEVVGTIRSGIIDASKIPDTDTFLWVMMAALLSAAIWLNIATAVGAPVSTTHAIVGAVLGSGVAAAGIEAANLVTLGSIVLSWLVSPLLGGVIAALFLYLIKRTITYQADMLAAARRNVPYLIAAMVWAFCSYLLLKSLHRLWPITFLQAILGGLVLAVVSLLIIRPMIARYSLSVENSKQGVNRLFTVPLIFAAGLLSFAHGSNDVSNAVGPLAAIVDVVASGGEMISATAPVPIWVLVVGALGISIGLLLFGPKLIRTVGSEITELDQMRAYCIAMAATIPVIAASQLGLPVSTTHIAVGAVFGVGFLREHLKGRYSRLLEEIKEHHPADDQEAIEAFIRRFVNATVEEKGRMVRELKVMARQRQDPAHFSKTERKGFRKVYREELVKRSQLMKIAAAWVITVPAAALMAAMLFYMLRGMLLK